MKLRIVCKTPPPEPGDHPMVIRVASYQDARVVAVLEDGSVKEIEGVTFLRWEVRPGEAAVARLEVHGAEIDAEGLVELAAAKRAPAAV